jgi:hypothetical protein
MQFCICRKERIIMRRLSEVLEALEQRWDAPLKEIQGFSYVPWEETAYHLSEVFGPLGWSDHTSHPQLDEKEVLVKDRDTSAWKPVIFQGYSCVVEIEVQVYDDIYGTGVLRASRSGPGFGPIIAQGDKNPLDTAEKAAGSDALSKAAKKFGDAFALFLYREKKKSGGSTYNKESNGGTDKSWGPTEKQKPHLLKYLDASTIAAMSYEQAKAFLDALWSDKLPPDEAAEKAGVALKEKAKSGLPVGAHK